MPLTAAHVGQQSEMQRIHAFPKECNDKTFAERVTARFIKECVRTKPDEAWATMEKTGDLFGIMSSPLTAGSFIDIEACGRLLRSADPFAEHDEADKIAEVNNDPEVVALAEQDTVDFRVYS